MANPGDIVRFLNEVGGGRITRIVDNIAYVEDKDGFEMPVSVRQIVVVQTAKEAAAQATAPSTASHLVSKEKSSSANSVSSPAGTSVSPVIAAPREELDIVETPEGDLATLVLGFEAENLKQLSTSAYNASLVNDSNYYISFTILTSEDNSPSGKWDLLYSGYVEPNIQLDIKTMDSVEITKISRLVIQGIAYKTTAKFDLQQPFSALFKVDNTKFFKLHCFKPSTYFDTPAITFTILRDGIPAHHDPLEPLKGRPLNKNVASGKQKNRERTVALRSKIQADVHPKSSSRAFSKPKYKPDETIEVDLHINSLVDNTSGLSPADMLNLQIDTFRAIMDDNLRNHGQKIVFIHGKGQGVLRQALEKELKHRYKGHDVNDASFEKYGFGATQVTIR